MSVNKIMGFGSAVFFVALAAFIAPRADETTIALLAGVFIALVVAIPATAAVVLLRTRGGIGYEDVSHHAAQPVQQPTQPRRIVIEGEVVDEPPALPKSRAMQVRR